MPIQDYYSILNTKKEYESLANKAKLENMLLESQVKKNSMLDVDALGEQAFMKAAQGLQLSPQEAAALKYVDAKSSGIGFDPATQSMYQKPPISQRMGLGGGYGQPSGGSVGKDYSFDVPAMSYEDLGGGYGGGMNSPPAPPTDMGQAPSMDINLNAVSIPDQVKAEYERRYREALQAASGNPKLIQELKTKYFKDMSEMNESQSKAAGFSDRVLQSEPILADPKKVEAGSSLWEKAKSAVPILGNYVVSDDFRSFNQAQRDFINAILRRESGAVIADSEFANAAQQYFPQPGDDPSVLAQKKANRDAALRGLVVSAGPAYQPISSSAAVQAPQVSDRASIEESIFNAKKAVRNGADREAVRQRLLEAGINPSLAGL